MRWRWSSLAYQVCFGLWVGCLTLDAWSHAPAWEIICMEIGVVGTASGWVSWEKIHARRDGREEVARGLDEAQRRRDRAYVHAMWDLRVARDQEEQAVRALYAGRWEEYSRASRDAVKRIKGLADSLKD